MKKSEYRIIGVMSGTSLDGIDLVYVAFSFDKTWSFQIINSDTLSYDEFWLKTLKDLVLFSSYNFV